VFCVKRVRSTRELADGAFERVRDVLHAPGLHPIVPFGRETVAWALPTADTVIRLPLASARQSATETKTRSGDAGVAEDNDDSADDGEQRLPVANALTSDAVPVAYEARMICVRRPNNRYFCVLLISKLIFNQWSALLRIRSRVFALDSSLPTTRSLFALTL
jgi:hypothetical protein